MTEPVITGGCLCGEVRYQLNGPPIDMGTCHCRNCQRWSGSAFHSAVAFALTDLSFTKIEPLRYQSSSIMERRFCPSCGSPLVFRYLVSIEDPPTANPETVWISVGSLDEPEIRSPDWHFGVEGQLSWVNFDDGLPRTRRRNEKHCRTISGNCGNGMSPYRVEARTTRSAHAHKDSPR